MVLNDINSDSAEGFRNYFTQFLQGNIARVRKSMKHSITFIENDEEYVMF